ncbi:hypothetical protein D3C85_1541200 [compost metagenome]
MIERIAFSLAIALGVEDTGQHVAVNPHVLGHQQVFQHRHFLEQANVLESPRQTGTVHQVGAAECLVEQPTGEGFR